MTLVRWSAVTLPIDYREGMDAISSIAERRIRAAQEAGMFDNLPGKGKPIPDLGEQRPPGWWAMRVAKRERSILRAEDLDRLVRDTKRSIWSATAESEIRDTVTELNDQIDHYNHTTTWEPRPRLNADELVEAWRKRR